MWRWLRATTPPTSLHTELAADLVVRDEFLRVSARVLDFLDEIRSEPWLVQEQFAYVLQLRVGQSDSTLLLGPQSRTKC